MSLMATPFRHLLAQSAGSANPIVSNPGRTLAQDSNPKEALRRPSRLTARLVELETTPGRHFARVQHTGCHTRPMRRQVPSGLSKTASNQSVTSSKAPCICSFSKKTHRLYDKVEGCLDVSCLKADGHRHMACMLQARAPANVGAAGCPRVLPWSLPAWTRSAAGRPCSMTACRNALQSLHVTASANVQTSSGQRPYAVLMPGVVRRPVSDVQVMP